ncbi:MAG: hypothetical protein ACRYF5_06135 [Janthinobacterium lividum]
MDTSIRKLTSTEQIAAALAARRGPEAAPLAAPPSAPNRLAVDADLIGRKRITPSSMRMKASGEADARLFGKNRREL